MQLNKLFQCSYLHMCSCIIMYFRVISWLRLILRSWNIMAAGSCLRRRSVGWGSRSKIVAVPWSLRIISVYSLPITLVSYCSRSKPFNVLQHEVKTIFTTSSSISPLTNSASPSPMCEDNHVTGQIDMLRVSVTVSKKTPLRNLFCSELAFWEQF